MSQFLLDAILRVFGIRGHIPGHDDFPIDPDRSSFAENSRGLMRMLAIAAAVVAVMSLVLWVAVLLAIKSL
jgi:hypothetical protein